MMKKRPELLVLIAALIIWAWICVPVIGGWRTFFLRDVFTTHLPLKAFGAEELREGRIPALNPTWGLGQPFRGNPNVLAFYPGNVFYLILPFWSAFNLHYALHWLIAFITMMALARGLGLGRAGMLMAGITWAGCGWMLSALTYYNVLTVAAWWPLAMLGAVRGGRRGVALGGLACGLALLGGEPVTSLLALAPLLVAAITRHGWKRGFASSVAIGATGVLIALPQVVALARILPFTVRGGRGMSSEQAAEFALAPARLLELFLPFPFGWPTHVGEQGIWASSVLPRVPLFFTLYGGIVALWLAATVARRYRSWALLAVAGPLLAILGGAYGDLLTRASFGLFRFPEKFLLWFALALPLLAGWGLERVVREGSGQGPGRWRKVALAGGGLALVLALAMVLLRPALISGMSGRLAALPAGQGAKALIIVETQTSAWAAALVIAGGALLAAALVTSERMRRTAWPAALLLALQLATLLQLHPVAATDSLEPYREPPPWARRLGPGAAVMTETKIFPSWGPDPVYDVPAGSRTPYLHLMTQDLDQSPGVLYGLTYPLVPDLEGLISPLYQPMLVTLSKATWKERVPWLRSVGLDALIIFSDPGVPGLRLVDQVERSGVKTRLYRVENPAPRVWWPERVVPAATSLVAADVVSASADPVAAVAAPPQTPHRPGGRVRLLTWESDRVEIDLESPGGLAVVRRSYHPLFEARKEDGERLRMVPVNLNLVGVLVPPGRHRVTVEVSARPEIIAGAIALAALTAVLAVLFRRRRHQ
jgi:hypothetical protein